MAAVIHQKNFTWSDLRSVTDYEAESVILNNILVWIKPLNLHVYPIKYVYGVCILLSHVIISSPTGLENSRQSASEFTHR